MLHTLLERSGLHAQLDAPLERAGALAVILLGLDIFISRGPFAGLFLRLFSQGLTGTKQGRRFLSQLAAKLVGTIFLAAVFPMCFNVLFDPEMNTRERFSTTTPASQRMVEVAAGYFIYDIIICLIKFWDNGFEFLLHAVVCCTVFTVAAARGVLHYYGAAFLMWELSTPFMYTRWLMIKAGMGASRAMMAVNVAFMATFFGCRIVWGPIMTLDFWQTSAWQLQSAQPSLAPAVIWVIRVMCIALNMLNTYWFGQMVRIALTGGKAKPTTKGV